MSNIERIKGFSPVLEQEGFRCDMRISEGSVISRDNGTVNAALKLFKHVLSPDDSRWLLAEEYERLRKQEIFNGVNFHNALMATYLSPIASWRNRGNHFSAEWTVRHLCRVLQNLKAKPFLDKLYRERQSVFTPGLQVEFAQTESISLGVDDRGIPGCPEALYQLRLFVAGDYAGRIGFNLHREESADVVSIVNVQGIPGGDYLIYEWFPQVYGSDPFGYLVRHVKRWALAQPEDNPMIIRGLRNPRANPALANTVLAHEGILRMTYRIPLWEG